MTLGIGDRVVKMKRHYDAEQKTMVHDNEPYIAPYSEGHVLYEIVESPEYLDQSTIRLVAKIVE